jgi:hypothetical protein
MHTHFQYLLIDRIRAVGQADAQFISPVNSTY